MSSELQFHAVSEADGGFLCDLSHNRIVTLNGTGAYVWLRLCDGLPASQIIDGLAGETGTQVEKVRREVTLFLEDLAARGLLPESIGDVA